MLWALAALHAVLALRTSRHAAKRRPSRREPARNAASTASAGEAA
jgi:hypothetical protein